ncbi:hypothetical protein OKA05_01510 [Luteolibacter arcticus]|uniref:Uncharacterized protein n=1 Tax=Luteolibacter arcticus TaxID=1581411 RepID=A0ABT3GC57_9BACT|nr:hypothetical protein [Luteolibacter arcticus]MCW1921209.1 hypothetical protein [Luteolibacter arcticus]
MITEEVKEAIRVHFPQFPVETAHKVPFAIYEWLVFNVWAKTRAAWTDEEIIADFMRNEGRQTDPWPDFGAT